MTEKESIDELLRIKEETKECIEFEKKILNDEAVDEKWKIQIEAIDTVIQALEQKDKEIQELKESDKRSSEQTLMMSQRHFNDSQKIKKLKADLYECNNIISDYIDTVKEKDKIIDLIYNTFYEFGCKFSGSFMKFLSKKGFNEDCEKCDYDTCDCKECIKQYLKKKAREENE